MKGLDISDIGHVKSCFKERFGIPRRPGLVPLARGMIIMNPEYANPDAFKELERFSHIWVIFRFHRNKENETEWTPTVRPPRLGGNRRVGVFASRSPFRPNYIGMSAVKLDGIRHENGSTVIDISGIDLLDGTPVLDIKPYIEDSDIVDSCNRGWIDSIEPKSEIEVSFSNSFEKKYESHSEKYPDLRELVEQIIKQDPRPSFHKNSPEPDGGHDYAFLLYDLDVHWNIRNSRATVTDIRSI